MIGASPAGIGAVIAWAFGIEMGPAKDTKARIPPTISLRIVHPPIMVRDYTVLRPLNNA
jgi:hypothetical protein